MVIDNLKNLRDYASLNPLFAQAIDYIESTDLKALAPGKIVLVENELIVNVNEIGPKTKEEAKLETHNEYIDIQIPLTDVEQMGYTQRVDLPEAEYDVNKDLTLYEGLARLPHRQAWYVHPLLPRGWPCPRHYSYRTKEDYCKSEEIMWNSEL